MSHWRIRSTVASALLVLGSVTGCSSDTASESRPTAATVVVGVDAVTAEASVGDSLEIETQKLAGTTIATQNEDLVSIYQGTEIDGVEVNPFVEARAPGTATVTVTRPNGSSYDLVITISNE
jgi:hypothetical protein